MAKDFNKSVKKQLAQFSGEGSATPEKNETTNYTPTSASTSVPTVTPQPTPTSQLRQTRPQAKSPDECRTKRANFVLRPSLYESIRAIAAEKGISINDAADEALTAYAMANGH